MFQKILVALDNSENRQRVFDQAFGLAKLSGASLMLFHTLSGEEEGSPHISTVGIEYYPMIATEILEMQQKQWAAYEQRSLEMLQSFTNIATSHGIAAEYTQNSGSPGRSICEVAQTWGANLIVIGRRGHSGLDELLLGSVSNYVLHHAPCSVLTVQGAIKIDSPADQTSEAATV